ncbi:hypothetical protein [Citrobacter phage Tr1]|nr:hypothetical protein [Citrobacter phage Tr1]
MTTIIATKTKILSDGKVTIGNRVDSTTFKKVRNIGGYLVGGAGRLSSVLNFFSWFEHNLQCQDAQQAMPSLMIQSDPDRPDEEFLALVVHPDGNIFIHEGNDPTRAYPLTEEYYAIGSGSDFALAALDAGATPEAAMEVAKARDAYSGGETYVEERQEAVELSDEDIRGFSREQLLTMLLTGSHIGDAGAEFLAAGDVAKEEVEGEIKVSVELTNAIDIDKMKEIIVSSNPASLA